MKKLTSSVGLKIFFSLLILSLVQCKKIEDPFYKYELTIEEISPTGGHEGTEVTIIGTGFSDVIGENSVKFNGTVATVTKATATSLVVGAPVGSTTGKISVTVNNKSAEGPVFTYLEGDRPQITGISPNVGWDYTLNAVILTGKDFGDDQSKVSVTFDGEIANVQSFSSVKLVVSPPKHDAGQTPVIVKVNGSTSNTVNYIYQQKPVITRVVVQEWNDSSHYFLSVDNLGKQDSDNKVTLNGEAMTIDSIFRAGSAEYDQEPMGEKLLIPEKELPPSVYQADFIVTSNGIKSDTYRFIFDPYIIAVYAGEREPNIVAPNDTTLIHGRFFGKQTADAKVELWNTPSTQGRNVPDPEILSWDNTAIIIVVPSYPVRYYDFDMELHVVTNGKEAVQQVKYIQSCPSLDEVYTGDYQYPGLPEEPYGIQLNTDGTMMFSSSYDDYPGTYTYDCPSRTVTMDFAGHGVIVTAIRENNALTHFTLIKSTGFNFLNGNLNTTWNQNLDGTTWKLDPPQGNSTVMTFNGARVRFDQGQTDSAYTRSAGAIRFTMDNVKYFATITGNKMEGESSMGIWVATKQ